MTEGAASGQRCRTVAAGAPRHATRASLSIRVAPRPRQMRQRQRLSPSSTGNPMRALAAQDLVARARRDVGLPTRGRCSLGMPDRRRKSCPIGHAMWID